MIKNYDAEFCGKVPLHQTNLIQPHGILLIVKKGDLSILQASENCDAIFGISAPELVTKSLTSFLAAEMVSLLHSTTGNNTGDKLPFQLAVGGKSYLTLVEQQDAYFIFEIEKAPHAGGSEVSFVSIYQDVKHAMAAIEACTTTEETCRVVAKELK
ncbi:MAG: hypothetical protein M3Q06_12220, partial [Bacteroidota bacterium]|nr:hypothetical protein [Bacteroidota bacterium]